MSPRKPHQPPTILPPTAPLISILVPIYNVERYLRQCLDSICRQTLQDIEIICINDGSTDSSLDIIKEFADQDARIIIIDKPNSGYGDSMNQGLKTARGKYIGIVESDDWVDQEAFQRLLHLAEQHRADIVKANHYTEQHGKSHLTQEITSSSPSNYYEVFRYAPAIWSMIYRRDFLTKNSIDFLPTPGASYQDLSFNFKVWATAERAVLTTEAYLHYRLDNPNSSVNNPGKVNCVVEEYAEITKYLQDHQLLDQFGHIMAAAKFRNYHWNLQRLAAPLARNFYQTMCSELTAAHQAGLLLPTDFSTNHWLALRLILQHPQLAYCILRARSRIHHQSCL